MTNPKPTAEMSKIALQGFAEKWLRILHASEDIIVRDVFVRDLTTRLASEVDRVIEERMKQITDEELEKEYSTDLATLCKIHNIPIKFDYLQGEMLEDFQYHNRLRHEGAKWFRNRIKGKQ